MTRNVNLRVLFFLLLVLQSEHFFPGRRGVILVEARMEAQFEKCCSLGTSWASEGLRCERFTGPVTGVPTVEQGLCLEAVDICCVREYHDRQCEKGKSDARAGLACVTGTKARYSGPGDYHRDCCEGCKLGILTGSMGQGCAFKRFTFGVPWDPAFLECCHEASPSTTTFTSDSTSATSPSENTESESSSSSTSSMSSSSSSSSSPSTSSSSSPSSSASSSSPSSSPLPSSSSSSLSPSSSSSPDSSSSSSSLSPSTLSTSSSTQFSPSIPTPPMDDICQLMKGMLCSDICVPTVGSYYCKCRDGFTLLEDEKTCRQDLPSDRCKSTNPCEQRCTDNGVAVICSCNPGYVLADDKRSCNPISSKSGVTNPDEDNELAPLCPAGYRYNSTNQACDDVNECIEMNVCAGHCENTIGSFICAAKDVLKTAPYEACPPGYQWEPRTGQCADIDECIVLTEPCPDDKKFCVNTQGSFTCLEMNGVKSCPAGYKFDKLSQQCKDVDECAEKIHSCFEDKEECRNTEGAYECDLKCEEGFTFSVRLGTCVDPDGCIQSNKPCPGKNTTCTNAIGDKDCIRSTNNHSPRSVVETKRDSPICPAGYKPTNNPKGACADVDECKEQLHACESNERCVNAIGSYRCETMGPDDSDSEEENEDRDILYSRGYKADSPLTVSPILNDTETCQPGFTFDYQKRRCTDVDECRNGIANCGFGEQCINSIGGYGCSPVCPPGFQLSNNTNSFGRIEESCQDIDECALRLHACNNSSQYCINTNGSYVCQAFATTTTTTTDRPLTDARYHRVQNADRYSSLESCRYGYKKDPRTGQCKDIDECATGPGCRDHEQCHNTPGGYECSPLCGTGWYFSTTTRGCQDVDECLLGRHDCPQSTHRCVNTNGSFVCEVILSCNQGFKRAFNGSCIDIDECSENQHNCRLELHQYCVNKVGSFECLTRLPSCQSGYEYSLGTRRCEDVDECATGQYTCDSRLSERCVNLLGTYRCDRPAPSRQRPRQRPACPSGYRYDQRLRMCGDIDECAEGLDSCGDEICYNQPGGYSCNKPPVPVTRKPPTSPLPAQPNQKCVDGTRFVRNRGCVDIDECREVEDACSSNEQCVNTMGSFTCNCKTGFRRDNLTQACVDINECQFQENNCLPTQRCDNTIGSYTCTRFLPCGTGYTLNAATEICEDDDECALGTHDCGNGYHCRNTLGSYRCDRNPRAPVSQPRTWQTTTTTTTTTTSTTPLPLLTPQGPRINCPRGFEAVSEGKCMDIDECQRNPNICGRNNQRCVNTVGSYRCGSKVLCGNGYTLDPASGQHCVDVDECADGTHECSPGQTCENRQGGYVCTCPPGHADGPNKDCVDIDECSIYGNKICGPNSRCENTVGSYRCSCDEGFEKVGGASGVCQDLDECQQNPGLCQHVCLNLWGSYRCGCESGFRLNSDNRSCSDVDECTEFKNNNLCIGICENTPGSYACKCPDGYRLGGDGRTCQDIDECETGRVCRGSDETCQNTRGGYRCNKINCPSGYYRDHERKNRCVRAARFCQVGDLACFRSPSHYSYNFITFVSMLPIPSSGQLELFTMRGTHLPGSAIQFSMTLADVRAPPGVPRATESCFAMRRPTSTQAVLVMTRSIQGPQEIELDLSMEIYHNSAFAGSAVAKLLIFVSQYEF